MGKLRSVKPRLGPARPRLGRAPDRDSTGLRRHDVPNNTARWQKLRLTILRRDAIDLSGRPQLYPAYTKPLFPDNPWLWPVCRQTGALLTGGKFAPDSPVVDHIIPHRGNLELFWDEDNLQTVSKAYHDKVKQSIEKRGLF